MINRIINILFASLLVIALSGYAFVNNNGGGNNKRTYSIGYMRNMFSDVDINDARAALDVWINEMARIYHYNDQYNLKTKLYNDVNNLVDNMKADSLAIIALDTYDYLNYSSKIGLDPVLAASSGEGVFSQYLLLVQKTSGFKDIKDLKGKRIGILDSHNHIASRFWLDIILAKENIPDKSRYFGRINYSSKESELILNLFFGKLEACVVSKKSLLLMSELNPQLSNKLTGIATSPKFLESVVSFTKQFNNQNDRKIFYSYAINAPNLTRARQLFTLLKINRLEPFQNDYLKSFKELIKEYNNLIKAKKILKNESN